MSIQLDKAKKRILSNWFTMNTSDQMIKYSAKTKELEMATDEIEKQLFIVKIIRAAADLLNKLDSNKFDWAMYSYAVEHQNEKWLESLLAAAVMKLAKNKGEE